jgi:hypothetical protein
MISYFPYSTKLRDIWLFILFFEFLLSVYWPPNLFRKWVLVLNSFRLLPIAVVGIKSHGSPYQVLRQSTLDQLTIELYPIIVFKLPMHLLYQCIIPACINFFFTEHWLCYTRLHVIKNKYQLICQQKKSSVPIKLN